MEEEYGEPEGDEPEVEQHGEVEIGGATSPIEYLRRRRKEIGEDRTLDLDIPGYEGILVCRYQRLDWDELKKITDKASKSKNPRRELIAHCDVLIKACQQFMIRKDGQLEPINNAYPEVGEEPVRYDQRLAAIFDISLSAGQGARTVVLALFNNDVAVTAHQGELVEWLSTSNAEDDAGF